uniref:Uncharacterized protein n=1 Tax=Aquila chrysaetos chrysaetos TaxID=223781 RepID=A0A663FAS5_AQUCH
MGPGIDDSLASLVIAQLLFLQRGGDLGLARCSTHLRHDGKYVLNTVLRGRGCVGQAAQGHWAPSALAWGGSGSLHPPPPHASHTPHTVPPTPPQGQATDIAIQAEEILQLKRQINGLYAKHTGQPLGRRILGAGDRYLQPRGGAWTFGAALIDRGDACHPPPRPSWWVGEDEPGGCRRSPPPAPSAPPNAPPGS